MGLGDPAIEPAASQTVSMVGSKRTVDDMDAKAEKAEKHAIQLSRRRTKRAKRAKDAKAAKAAEDAENAECTQCHTITGYFIIDEATPLIYTLLDEDGSENIIDEGDDFSGTIVKFGEYGWELHGTPWTYTTMKACGTVERYHCQAVVCYD